MSSEDMPYEELLDDDFSGFEEEEDASVFLWSWKDNAWKQVTDEFDKLSFFPARLPAAVIANLREMRVRLQAEKVHHMHTLFPIGKSIQISGPTNVYDVSGKLTN